MGENRWRNGERTGPWPRTRYVKWYMHSGGSANSLDGDGTLSTAPRRERSRSTYTAMTRPNPVPTRGGSTLIIPQGVADQREVERRDDVLVYTSEPLERDMELTGPITVHPLRGHHGEWTPISRPSWWTCDPTVSPTTFRTALCGRASGHRWRNRR